MAERRIHTTGRPWEAQGGYARAVRIGDLVETSLCSPAADDGTILFPGDVFRQTQVSLRVIGESLRALGMDFRDVIKTRIYLADPPRWVEAARARRGVRRDPPRARLRLHVGVLPPRHRGRGRGHRLPPVGRRVTQALRLAVALALAGALASCSGGGFNWGWHVVSPGGEQGRT